MIAQRLASGIVNAKGMVIEREEGDGRAPRSAALALAPSTNR